MGSRVPRLVNPPPTISNIYKVVFHFGRFPFWSSSILVVFHFGHLPFWSSSILVVFNLGCLPFWSSSILVVIHFGRLPFRLSSILVIFNFCLQPFWSKLLLHHTLIPRPALMYSHFRAMLVKRGVRSSSFLFEVNSLHRTPVLLTFATYL